MKIVLIPNGHFGSPVMFPYKEELINLLSFIQWLSLGSPGGEVNICKSMFISRCARSIRGEITFLKIVVDFLLDRRAILL